MHTSQVSNLPGVYQISLAWSNCYVLRSDSGGDAWLIDTGLCSDRADLFKALDDLGIVPAQVSAVLLTHGHCDHAGNAAFFNSEYGSQIYTHRDEAIYLNDSKTPYGRPTWNSTFSLFQSLVFRIGERRFPVMRCNDLNFFDDGDMISAPGGALRVIHCPGHTPGHMAFYRESDHLLFSGDAILNIVPHIIPSRRRVDLCIAPKIFCSNWENVNSSALKIVQLGPTILASGHGPPLVEDATERLKTWGSTLM